jgi:hypothetical protein
VDYHFVCFVPVAGHLYELDGRKAFAINHGATTAESFLMDSAKVIREQFMVRVAWRSCPVCPLRIAFVFLKSTEVPTLSVTHNLTGVCLGARGAGQRP